MVSVSNGYRGYIASRSVRGSHTPQRVQNLVVRDYAQRTGLPYRLSAVEFVMPGCYMMLESLLDEIGRLDGIIAYSLFMLPLRKERRMAAIERVLNAGASLHFALENLVIAKPNDAQRCEDVIDVALALPQTPWEGRYERFLAAPVESAHMFNNVIDL